MYHFVKYSFFFLYIKIFYYLDLGKPSDFSDGAVFTIVASYK